MAKAKTNFVNVLQWNRTTSTFCWMYAYHKIYAYKNADIIFSLLLICTLNVSLSFQSFSIDDTELDRKLASKQSEIGIGSLLVETSPCKRIQTCPGVATPSNGVHSTTG